MNRSIEILDYLRAAEGPATVLIAPNAPPVLKTPDGLEVAMDFIMAAADVNDTLATLKTRSGGAAASSTTSAAGCFSFGVKDAGRFRVTYITQRGSKVVFISRVPYCIPDSASICDNTVDVDRLTDVLCSPEPALIAVQGPHAVDNSIFVYSLLRAVNKRVRRVIYIIERSLTYLMGHENSIVIQTELTTDVGTIEECMQNALIFDPDVVYLGDLRPYDETPPGGGLVPWSSVFGALREANGPIRLLMETYRTGPEGFGFEHGIFQNLCPDPEAFVKQGGRFLKAQAETVS